MKALLRLSLVLALISLPSVSAMAGHGGASSTRDEGAVISCVEAIWSGPLNRNDLAKCDVPGEMIECVFRKHANYALNSAEDAVASCEANHL
jgi:hypothetical protein